MTNYDAMPAGREMDALVAEKVMGWRFLPGYNRWEVPAPDGRWLVDPKPYSTDIAAAWEVFMRMRELGYIPAIAQCQSGLACDFWTVSEAGDNGRVAYISRFRTYGQESAPLAICRAALNGVA